jgi:hypothetical protein
VPPDTSNRWRNCPDSSRHAPPLTWAEVQFTLAQKDVASALVLDIGSNNGGMRGHFYLNGVDLGRLWGIAQGGATVQQYYYLPVDVVRAHMNRLTIVSDHNRFPLHFHFTASSRNTIYSSHFFRVHSSVSQGDGGGRLS